MITEELIEELDLPNYDKWAEHIWTDDYWWDWILDEWVNDCDAMGIRIDSSNNNTPEISFDIWGKQCASKGQMYGTKAFYNKYQTVLMECSPVYAQMLLEDWIDVSWKISRNGWLETSVDFSYNFDDDDEFNHGLFAGTSVRALIESEPVTFDDFADVVSGIIDDIHDDPRKSLESAYEYDTSEERYKEWILDEIYNAVSYQQTVLNKTTVSA